MFRFVWFLTPLYVFTFGFWQVSFIAYYFYEFISCRIKITKCFLISFMLLMLLFVFQTYYNSNHPVYIFSNVVSSDFRTHGTLGSYYVDGSINILLLMKFFVYLFLAFFVSKTFSSVDFLVRFLYRLFVFILFLCLVFLFLSYFDFFYYLFKGLSRQEPGLGNFLVRDSFGYRISAGFVEPSLMSVFSGTLAGIIFKYLPKYKKIFILLSVAFIFIVSRSLSIIIVFFAVHFLHNYFKILFVGAISFILLFILFLKDYFFDGYFSFLFRSANERLHVPLFDYHVSQVLFGIDFGQVYSFIPVVNHLMQFGVLGVIIFYVMFRFDVRSFVVYLCISFITPQFWFPMQWICLGLILARKNLESK